MTQPSAPPRPIADRVGVHADAALAMSRDTPDARPPAPLGLDRGIRSTARELDRAEEEIVLLATVVGRAETASRHAGDLAVEAQHAVRRLRAHDKRALAPPTQRGPASAAH